MPGFTTGHRSLALLGAAATATHQQISQANMSRQTDWLNGAYAHVRSCPLADARHVAFYAEGWPPGRRRHVPGTCSWLGCGCSITTTGWYVPGLLAIEILDAKAEMPSIQNRKSVKSQLKMEQDSRRHFSSPFRLKTGLTLWLSIAVDVHQIPL